MVLIKQSDSCILDDEYESQQANSQSIAAAIALPRVIRMSTVIIVRVIVH